MQNNGISEYKYSMLLLTPLIDSYESGARNENINIYIHQYASMNIYYLIFIRYI